MMLIKGVSFEKFAYDLEVLNGSTYGFFLFG